MQESITKLQKRSRFGSPDSSGQFDVKSITELTKRIRESDADQNLRKRRIISNMAATTKSPEPEKEEPQNKKDISAWLFES